MSACRCGLLLTMILISACTSPQVNDYAQGQPDFALEKFFRGSLSAHGVIYDRRGTVTRTFNATILASQENGMTVLREDFLFDDGEQQQRVWRIKADQDIPGQYLATAGDVIGTGLLKVAGNALNLRYMLQIQYRGKPLSLRVDDWMYRVSDDVVINESVLRKWGIRLGRIQLAIVRHPPA